MMVGCPILGLATTEMVTAVTNGVNGYVETDLRKLWVHMDRLLKNRDEALELSKGALAIARERFDIRRFVRDWEAVINEAVGASAQSAKRPVSSYEEAAV
jgi:glycosyltransferase involved in cell wall biosynthesis